MMIIKILSAICLLLLSIDLSAQDFRGKVQTKTYNENGKLKVLSMHPEVLVDGDMAGIMIEKDTQFVTYSICSDTVFQFTHYGDYNYTQGAAQVGRDFYIYSTQDGLYFKFRAPPHPIESFAASDWERSKRKYRKKGLDYIATYKKDRNYEYYAEIDTQATVYNRFGYEQGILNYLFPLNGLFAKIAYEFNGEQRITEYSYELSNQFSCDELMSDFRIKDVDEKGVDGISLKDIEDMFDSSEADFSIIPMEEREKLDVLDVFNNFSQSVNITDYNGAYLYIDVWASWCAPCIKEMSFLKEIRNHYQPDKLKILSISVDEEEKQNVWRRTIDKLGMTWINWRVNQKFDNAFCSKYDVTAIPRYILVDPHGRIINLNAPRPSNDRLIEWLDSVMATN